MSAGEPRRIGCPQCGGALDLYGGHKVRAVVCRFCGSQLDPQDEFKLLLAHRELSEDRAWMPLELGMQGRLKGVDYTIIGLVQYFSAPDSWVEFCLYSPTHGYQWLSWEKGHWIFYRRVRTLPSPQEWWQLTPKRGIKALGRRFEFYEAYTAEIRDLAGELPWTAKREDQVRMADAIAPPLVLSVEQTGAELEYALGEYLPLEQVQAAFAGQRRESDDDWLAQLRPSSQVHPAQPYVQGPLLSAVRAQAWKFALLALALLALVTFMGRGHELLRESFTASQLSTEEPASGRSFQVHNADRLLELELRSPLDNAWTWYDVGVERDGEELFSVGKEISYYQGVEGGEHWSEGAQTVSLLFRVPEPGQYQLWYQASEGEGRRQGLQVTIREGVLLSRWFAYLAVLFGLAAALPWAQRWWFEARRWKPVTADDDD